MPQLYLHRIPGILEHDIGGAALIDIPGSLGGGSFQLQQQKKNCFEVLCFIIKTHVNAAFQCANISLCLT